MRIDGRAIASQVRAELAGRIAALRERRGVTPTLAIVVATDDESTAFYVRSLVRTAQRLGIEARTVEVSRTAAREEIRETLATASADPAVHGVICQTPLPGDLRLEDVGDAIAPDVDVDGANPTSLGRLAAGLPGAFLPATAAAVMKILEAEGIALLGRRAVVI